MQLIFLMNIILVNMRPNHCSPVIAVMLTADSTYFTLYNYVLNNAPINVKPQGGEEGGQLDPGVAFSLRVKSY